MSDSKTNVSERPNEWPKVFFVSSKWCDHRFEWESRPPKGRYICTRCGEARAEPPECVECGEHPAEYNPGGRMLCDYCMWRLGFSRQKEANRLAGAQ